MTNKSKINILQVVPNLDMGGLEKMVIELAKRLDKSKFNVSVCCLLPPGPADLSKELNGSCKVRFLDKKEKVDWSLIGKLGRTYREEKPDVVHTHDSMANLYGALAARLNGVKACVNTDHGGIYFETPRKKMISRWLLGLNKRMVCVSSDLKNNVEAMGHDRIKLQVVANGIDLKRFNVAVDKHKVRENLNIGHDDFVITAIGRLELVKNLSLLIDAAPLIIEKIPNVKFLIIGDGKLKDPLMQHADFLGVSDHFIFPGFIGDIISVLRSSDCFVNCSNFESFGLAIIEAMASGVPVVATNAGGVGEIVLDGQTGILIDRENKKGLVNGVGRIHDERPLARTLAEAAKKMVTAKFSIERMVKDYEELYLKVAHADPVSH